MINVIRYNSLYKDDFKRLNYEWIEKYFKVEPIDEQLLSNPESEVLDKGGVIFIAVEEGKAIGTACILKIDKQSCEIGKMAVFSAAQGRGVGRLLMNSCLEECKVLGFNTVILYTNEQLIPANKMYQSFGFVEVPNLDSYYERGGVKYVKDITEGI